MSILNFFKRPRKSKNKSSDNPSPEQKLFSEKVIEIIVPILEQFGFTKHRVEIGHSFSTITYRKNSRYIKVSSTTHPKDYPHYYWISFGEGDSEDLYEYDWNSISLFDFQNALKPNGQISNYDFPSQESLTQSLQNAKKDLIEYGLTFLKGELNTFYKIRKERNTKRKPYQIRKLNKDGKYEVFDEPKSAKQKEKYS